MPSCPRPAAITRSRLPFDTHPSRSERQQLLKGVHLSEADLRGADLSNADLSGADLTNADLTGAEVAGARFDGDRPEGLRGRPPPRSRP
ncbi:pentapeptide repeat-containing protein [Streptomyces sp. NPDC017254]|uniref:pentapeptide repeat-containing protein n=1 Tax=Streptomyces sp. NPDC017254 TaxID=3364989 RepID=UPI0037A24E77